ncbi:hypothetical protein [Bacillus sp. EB01]|uniref:hypothetical protein n=1 Tax=Bacillus sp. EB01 TaxID=1347086 RepID=UPI0005C6F190|nr:hypothetical protein [Bacillus sp. EB01]
MKSLYLVMGILLFSFNFSPLIIEVFALSEKEIDIATSPEKVLFNIVNARPGDVYSNTLTVVNSGTENYNYLFSNKFLNGTKKFYNELLLTVSDKNGDLYNGKLMDFEKLNLRPLNAKLSEKLVFSIEVPLELGNEYQGMSSEFEFKFYAEGTLGGLIPPDDVPLGPIDTPLGPIKLPDTATEAFNFLAAGLIMLTVGFSVRYIIKFKKKITDTSLTRP